MTDFYVFTMYASKGYTMVTASAAEASAYEEEPDCVVFNNPSDALDWLDQAAEHFDRQAFLEYRSVLEEAIEVEGNEPEPSKETLARVINAMAEQAETEPAAPVLTPQAAAVMCEALETAAGKTLADFFRETSACPKSAADLLATVERLESYRLALSVVAAAWAKAERAAQEG